MLRPNTKLISINFPHNPTGKIISESNLRALVTLCRERGIWLFSDEVYRGIESDPTKRASTRFSGLEMRNRRYLAMLKVLAAVSLERSIAVIGAGIVGAAVGLALGCGRNQ